MTDERQRRDRILAERAALLARVATSPETAEDLLEVAVCTVGSETFAIPVEHLREIVPLPHVTPVPGCPDWLLGIVHVRGSLLSVLHLGRFCRAKGESRGLYLAVVEGIQGPLGLTVDEVLSVRKLSRDGLLAADGDQRRAALGVTKDLVVVLDIPFLLGLPEVVVE